MSRRRKNAESDDGVAFKMEGPIIHQSAMPPTDYRKVSLEWAIWSLQPDAKDREAEQRRQSDEKVAREGREKAEQEAGAKQHGKHQIQAQEYAAFVEAFLSHVSPLRHPYPHAASSCRG